MLWPRQPDQGDHPGEWAAAGTEKTFVLLSALRIIGDAVVQWCSGAVVQWCSGAVMQFAHSGVSLGNTDSLA